MKFKGVRIGEVTEIFIRYRQPADSPHVPVIIEIDTERLQRVHNVEVNLADPEELSIQIAEGLRATLVQESFVTGRLFIEMDIFPEERGSPPVFIQSRDGSPDQPPFPEIPTLRFGLTEMLQKVSLMINQISEIDIAAIANDLKLTIQSANSLLMATQKQVEALDVSTLNAEAVASIRAVRQLLEDPELQNTVTRLNATLTSINAVTQDASAITGDLKVRTGPLLDDLSAATQQVQASLREAELLLADTRSNLLGPDAPINLQLQRTLVEVSATARSIARLADLLERQPNSLIWGRQDSKNP